MKKEECIERYGEAAWQKLLKQRQAYYKAHREDAIAYSKKYYEENPEKAKAIQHEANRKGGKRYEQTLEYNHTGLQGARNKIRSTHANQYKQYKDIIAPDSQIHHEWIPDTSEYRGLALVEKEAHMHGVVDVIDVLDGKISLLTEEEVKKGKQNKK